MVKVLFGQLRAAILVLFYSLQTPRQLFCNLLEQPQQIAQLP